MNDIKKTMKYRKKRIALFLFFVALTTMLIILFQHGKISFNKIHANDFTVRGVDVSRYQGDIDWAVLASQNITFAFIKATEGSSHTDPKFVQNWTEAQKTNLVIGAYHFFSFESSGETQAENFINTVQAFNGMLAPVVDIELYGKNKKYLPDNERVQAELNILLMRLEEKFGIKPIIYTTLKTYRLYIDGAYDEYPLWIRNVYTKPYLANNKEWIFWQYSDKGHLNGYDGEEKFIDMNVFNGSFEELQDYIAQGAAQRTQVNGSREIDDY